MSLLAPLYFLGLAAVSLPILFHLIRRTPRGRQQFSSLMFLTPSPPRLTRRSRVENWLLLLLRAAALILLALAFCRPFLRQVANLSFDGVRGRRVAIVVDTSASMRRDGVWQRATEKVDEIVNELDPSDEVALYTFDRDINAIVPFAEEVTSHQASWHDVVRNAATSLSPTWNDSDLGSALVTVAEEMTLASDEPELHAVSQIIVISDMQQGVDLQAIQEYEWPKEVLVAIETIDAFDPSNATLALLSADDEGPVTETVRVRVENSPESTIDQFHVGWSLPSDDPGLRQSKVDDNRSRPDTSGEQTDGQGPHYKDVPVYVPAGQSRVVQVPKVRGANGSDRLVLHGDPTDFDNTFYVVPQIQDDVEMIYVGNDARSDPSGLHYYLELALGETPRRKVNLRFESPAEAVPRLSADTRMIVVTAELPDAAMKQVRDYVSNGGCALFVPTMAASSTKLAAEFDYLDYKTTESGSRDDYLMLVDIDFSHPVLKPFAIARYSDFTKIHFWRHQRFSLASEHTARIMAWFDNGDPAMWQQTQGEGSIYVFASGWHPEDSQLALSTKFVPLLNTLLDQAAGTPVELPSFIVGENVQWPSASADYVVTKPNGVIVEQAAEDTWFRDTDQPGIYEIRDGSTIVKFAVNLTARESDTATLDIEQLSELGVGLGEHRTREEESDHQRQLRDIELESQQQLWRWLIVVVLGILGLETWLAGRKPAVSSSVNETSAAGETG